MSAQYHFDFKDWREAFATFYRKKAKDKTFCLVISLHPYSSGYWIERGATNGPHAQVYRSIKAAKRLEDRIAEAIKSKTLPDGTAPLSLGRVIL